MMNEPVLLCRFGLFAENNIIRQTQVAALVKRSDNVFLIGARKPLFIHNSSITPARRRKVSSADWQCFNDTSGLARILKQLFKKKGRVML
jgi:hypothetical protein